jgi:hypothetical protein
MPTQKAQEITRWSQKDATGCRLRRRAENRQSHRPAHAYASKYRQPSSSDLGNAEDRPPIRSGKKDMYGLRWGPNGGRRLGLEFFTMPNRYAPPLPPAASSNFSGPWSRGALVLLLRAASDPTPAPYGCREARAVCKLGSCSKQGRSSRHADIAKFESRMASQRHSARSGEEISANAVVSNADPKRTLMRLVDPTHLAPDFVQKIKNYRSLGTVAKINLALSGLPEFPSLKASGNGNLLKGRIQISPEIDYLERAFDESKYGNSRDSPIGDHVPFSPIRRSLRRDSR